MEKKKAERINSMDKERYLSKKIEYFKICLYKIASKHDNTLSITLQIFKRYKYLGRFTKKI